MRERHVGGSGERSVEFSKRDTWASQDVSRTLLLSQSLTERLYDRVSGLQECKYSHPIWCLQLRSLDSEKVNAFLPLGIHAVSIAPSPTAHVFTTLDTVTQADAHGVKQGIYGKDVMVWGGNGTSPQLPSRKSKLKSRSGLSVG